jgi:uncharacterized protein (DUF736 family)
MKIGEFEKYDNDSLVGWIETLGIHKNPVRFVRLDKGADYAVCGPENAELGAAWRKSGEWGAYLSVRLDCPTLPAPISATMRMTASEDGLFQLRWNRRGENGRGEKSKSQPGGPE